MTKQRKDPEIQPMRLYREDLLDIEEILKTDLGADNIEIIVDDVKYSTVNEIINDFRPAAEIIFKTSSNRHWFSIHLLIDNSWIQYDANDLEEAGVVWKLHRVFQDRKKNREIFIHKICLLLVVVLIFVFILPISSWANLIVKYEVSRIFDFLLAIAFFAEIFLFYRLLSLATIKHTIIFSKKATERNFIERNRDQITVGLIVGGILGLLGFMIGRFFS